MKKILFLSMIILTFFVSCVGGTKSTKDEKIVLKFAGWNIAAKTVGKIAEEYEKENPNVKIEIMESDAAYRKITPALVSGQGAPDIILVQTREAGALYRKFPGQFYDLTELMKKDGLDKKFVKSEIDSITVDGKMIAIPWGIGPTGIFYRKDMFEKAGIKAEDIETWEDFIKAGKKLQAALPDVTMLGIEERTINEAEILFRQFGGSYVKNGKLALDSKEAIEAYELLTRMKKEGITFNVGDWNGRIVAINNNKVATIMLPVWYGGTIKTTAESQKGLWGIMELPALVKGGNRRSILGGSSLAISTQSKHPEEAYKFAKRVTSELEGLKVMAENGLFSAYTPFYETKEFKKVDDYFGIDVNSFFSELTKGVPSFDHGIVMLDGAKTLHSMNEEIMKGKDIKTALKETSEKLSQTLKIEINK